MKKILLVTILSVTALLARGGGVDIGKLMKPSFSKNTQVTKKQLKLNTKQVKLLQKKAQAKLDSNVIRLYTAKNGSKTEGYGVLLLQTIRTKKAAVLYIMDTKAKIKSIEIVAFKEPIEYKPKQNWQNSFKGKTKEKNLYAGKGIPTISGATMSARAISDAARIAIALVEEL
ncbi:MAG TPA: FMN-binding protein [Sulfurovum sp.]|nr:FMN-binding protein [Sulfurovum sp.]